MIQKYVCSFSGRHINLARIASSRHNQSQRIKNIKIKKIFYEIQNQAQLV